MKITLILDNLYEILKEHGNIDVYFNDLRKEDNSLAPAVGQCKVIIKPDLLAKDRLLVQFIVGMKNESM